ncbi:MAG TPA: bifunctional demethylmenaquinone methyltransferase/2-methoxy-6-polyprenyl-1,4-benzoquinol methylase UbiE [Bacteroidales bacterium]|nr:bifunctional demethylmenaquinone methyltransferase/2-methoxy-6-polyprenyl-1,4-benzoquinol methylase UbiE [Bacteroidales bacterium]HPT12519.1 bifunctional demethylmenaquinone methyltransferase/2-methoxy-6-polyprenyl-1,4-benzoquinol methylase UbiE [Bacteroidales bacterium]
MDIKDDNSRSKANQVEAMFDDIAHHYDFLNHFLSMGTDRLWRRRAINIIGRNINPNRILDVATGTGDLAIAALRLKPDKITGIDISEKMLELGREKISRRGLDDKIELLKADSEAIPFTDGSFDAAMCAFGVRNFSSPIKGLSEICRVLRHGGMIMVLEFSKPSYFPVKQLYFIYFRRILPLLGRIISGDAKAYTYLPESVMAFPEGDRFVEILSEAGFGRCGYRRLSGGIATIYYAFKN